MATNCNKWQWMTTSGYLSRLLSLTENVVMVRVFKKWKSHFILQNVIANISNRCIQNLFKFTYSLSLVINVKCHQSSSCSLPWSNCFRPIKHSYMTQMNWFPLISAPLKNRRNLIKNLMMELFLSTGADHSQQL